MAEKKTEKHDMTVREAGKKGGERTAETHGHDFYSEIGHKGGERTAETHGHDFYSEIGHKGGEKVRDLIEKGKEEENR